jgi:hypothetical protein
LRDDETCKIGKFKTIAKQVHAALIVKMENLFKKIAKILRTRYKQEMDEQG